MIARTLFSPEHEIICDSVRRFYEREIVPHREQWEKDGVISREAWRRAGEAGLLCATMPEAYAGAGADRLYSAIVMEEQAYAGASGPGFSLRALDKTVAYAKQRRAFGRPVASFQNSRFKLAEMKTEVQIGRVFVDRCLELALTDELAEPHQFCPGFDGGFC